MQAQRSLESIGRRIHFVRGHRIMLDADLAELYGVPTKSLNLAVKRNMVRFPEDFMFRLTPVEARDLRFQSETSSWGGRRHTPHVFTEQGVAMLSSVLRSKQAALVNIAIMRAFVKLSKAMAVQSELAEKLAQLERRVHGHDVEIGGLFEAIKRLLTPPRRPRPRIGFRPESPRRDPGG